MNKYNFVAPCLMGVEKLLSDELKFIGAENVKAENGRVFFDGDDSIFARANIRSRFAERILLLTGRFIAKSFDELFCEVKKIPWENFIPENGKFPVAGSCLSSALHSVSDCQSIIKKAIVERLKTVYHHDYFQETGAVFKIRFLLLKDEACIMIDTSGEPLHKRGYRANSNDAPLKETLAAVLVDLSRVHYDDTVIDPCCGSGTILIEAAQKALRIPPNSKRKFVSEDWHFPDKKIWSDEKILAENEIRINTVFHGYGYDIDENALAVAQQNAEKAGVAEYLTFSKRDIADFSENFDSAVIICNPPYGERLLDLNSAETIYRIMGEKFYRRQGWRYTIISPEDDFEKFFGRRADKRRKLYNGMIRCQVYQYFK